MEWGNDYAVAVVVTTPKGIILVKRPGGSAWVFPGGKGSLTEGSHGDSRLPSSDVLSHEKTTAVNKVFEKTGIHLRARELRTLHAENRDGHQFYLFAGGSPWTPARKNNAKNEILMGIFTPKALRSLTRFFPTHQELFLKYFAVIAPDESDENCGE